MSVRAGASLRQRLMLQVPVDGVTVSGAAHVSNAHITGEALPILAQRDTELLSGALATDSWLIERATKVALARIRELTEFAKVGFRPVLCLLASQANTV